MMSVGGVGKGLTRLGHCESPRDTISHSRTHSLSRATLSLSSPLSKWSTFTLGVRRDSVGRVGVKRAVGVRCARESQGKERDSDESGKGFGAPALELKLGTPSEPTTGGGRTGGGGGGGGRGTPRDAEEAAFEERLAAVKRAAEEKKRADSQRSFSAIDYDNPEQDTSGIGTAITKDLGSKIGIGIAATVFAAIFAFGDILPPVGNPNGPSTNSSQSYMSSQMNSLAPEQRDAMQVQLEEIETKLASNPEDQNALESAAVLSVELGDLQKGDVLLSRLEKVAPGDVEVLRLHAEVQYALSRFGDSTQTYRKAIQVYGDALVPPVELLQGLTQSLVADGKTKEAVDELLAVRKSISSTASDAVDSVQVDLLLGKAYVAWGKPGDAIAVYDGLISSRRDDFRGYLAKAMLLKGQGKEGDAQRMFLQAKYLAPDAAKSLVDRLALASN